MFVKSIYINFLLKYTVILSPYVYLLIVYYVSIRHFIFIFFNEVHQLVHGKVMLYAIDSCAVLCSL